MKLSRRQSFGAAAAIALVVAVLLFVVLNKRVTPPEPVEAEAVGVVVAKTNIPAYTELTAGMVGMQDVPKDQVPPQALGQLVVAIGQVAQFDLKEGQTLTRGDVMPAGARQGLTFVIGDGMRAITVALDPVSGVGGFAQPTDRVDVVATFDQGEMAITKTILQDVEVLAINEQTIRPPVRAAQASDAGAEKEKEEAPTTEQIKSVTLAVTPHQAQILVLSASRGSIHLVLRPRGDHAMVVLQSSNEWGITGRVPPPEGEEQPGEEGEDEKPEREEEPEKEAEKPTGPPPPTVTVIRGDQREVVVME